MDPRVFSAIESYSSNQAAAAPCPGSCLPETYLRGVRRILDVARLGTSFLPGALKTTAIAYWLVPAEPANELFREIIGILAKQLDAPRFQPHMTICAALRNGRSAGVVLRQISLGPIRLRVRGVRYANRFSKTLFVRFQGNRALDELNASLRRAAELSAGVLRDPHVSLLYKRMPTAAKKQLVSTIRLPMQEVVFDSLKAVRCITPTESRSDVEAWRVVATKKLRD